MCGICGLVSAKLSAGDAGERALRMANTIRHRGPDGEGVAVFGAPELPTTAALGHRRLSIIDLSAAGAQPMSNEDDTVWIVFNGEIYNFKDLRSDLQHRGHHFKSETDTEAIIHLYEEYGARCFELLNGIFAVAILDLRAKKLLLARDHIGVKPLYYAQVEQGFVFGSEIKALLRSDLVRAAVDWQSVSDYFTYLYVPAPATAFEGIQQLPPAHCLSYDLETNTATVQRYWQIRLLPSVRESSPAALRAQARELLEDTVRRQMMSDVPLGVFLSGGVDSNIVAGLMKKAGAEVRSYTVIFEGAEFKYFDERETVRAASRHLGTVHEELSVRSADPLQLLNLLGSFDQPFGNPTYYLMWLISRAARDRITVALCGAGGDELFAGYPRYAAVRLARRLRWIPRPMLQLIRRALNLAKDNYSNPLLRRAKRFLDGMDPDFARQFMHWTYFMNGPQKSALLGPDAGHFERSERVLQAVLDRSPFPAADDNRILELDLSTFLVDNVLEYTDKMSMAVGLEVRVPLLDRRFVEWSANVPFSHKVHRGRTKVLLREAFSELFPTEVVRAPKRGFNAPLAHWMSGFLDGYFEASMNPAHPLCDVLGGSVGETWKGGLLNWDAIQAMRRQLKSGAYDASYELFSVIAFDVWHREYITGCAYQN